MHPHVRFQSTVRAEDPRDNLPSQGLGAGVPADSGFTAAFSHGPREDGLLRGPPLSWLGVRVRRSGGLCESL